MGLLHIGHKLSHHRLKIHICLKGKQILMGEPRFHAHTRYPQTKHALLPPYQILCSFCQPLQAHEGLGQIARCQKLTQGILQIKLNPFSQAGHCPNRSNQEMIFTSRIAVTSSQMIVFPACQQGGTEKQLQPE